MSLNFGAGLRVMRVFQALVQEQKEAAGAVWIFFLLKLASSDSQRASAFHLDPPHKNIKPYAHFVASKGQVPACVTFPRGPRRLFPQNEGLTKRLLEAGTVFAADFSAPLFQRLAA